MSVEVTVALLGLLCSGCGQGVLLSGEGGRYLGE